MKKRYSVRLIYSLLFVWALVCTSCGKEDLPVLKKENDSTEPLFDEYAKIDSKKKGLTVASKPVYLNPSTAWYKNGPAIKLTQSRPLTAYAKIILPEEKNEWVAMELYQGSIHTGLSLIAVSKSSSDKASSGYRYTSLTWSASAGSEYYVRISCANGSGWLPKVELDQSYAMTIPGSSITVLTGITFP